MRVPPAFDFTPTLVGEAISLRPLQAGDFEAVFAVAADPLLWEQHPSPLRYTRDVFETEVWAGAIHSAGALVVVDRVTGKIIGSSRFYDWDSDAKEVAIGFTFLARSHWGGASNGELKRIMLQHAFRWAKVVWFHVGSNNLRSRKALEKIGAAFSHEEARGPQNVVHAFYRIEAPTSPVPLIK